MKPRRIAVIAFAVLFAAASYLFVRAPSTNAEAAYRGKPEVVAATFASAWCSSCKVLKPKLARVIPRFKDQPVTFIELDFTFGPSDDIRGEAAQFGVEDLYDRNKGATGFTVLVDYDTGKILDTLTMNFSEDAMRSAISRALAVASYTDETPAPDAGAPL
ncbi:MAG: hypothetical protein KDD85_08280 [Parvularculaceae bacterium]|nr:hypothetical protein [Parvularculaceae bacterium]